MTLQPDSGNSAPNRDRSIRAIQESQYYTAWNSYRVILQRTLDALPSRPASILPAFVPGVYVEGTEQCWVFDAEQTCDWCGGHAGRYRSMAESTGPVTFCADCWTLDAFHVDGTRLAHASRRHSRMLSRLPEGAHITEITLDDGAVRDTVWTLDPGDVDTFDPYYALRRGDYGIAFMEFLWLIEKEAYLQSFFHMAEMCVKGGRGLPADVATALKLYRLGAELGDLDCLLELGRIHEMGEVVPTDYLEAMRLYRTAIEMGSKTATAYLGRMFYFGLGVEPDFFEARRLLQGAGEFLSPGSAHCLARMCHEGQGGPVDFDTAFRCIQEAAMFGATGASYELGVMYAYGRGTPVDMVKARQCFKKAADAGYMNAQFNMGVMCRDGSGGPKDLTEAVAWFQKAAEQGDEEANKLLGDLFTLVRGDRAGADRTPAPEDTPLGGEPWR